MTTLQVRIDESLKKKAQKIAHQMGMDLSSAIKVFLTQMVITEGLPFTVRTANGFTPIEEQQMLQQAKAAIANGKRYASADELFSDILGANWRADNAQQLRHTKNKKIP